MLLDRVRRILRICLHGPVILGRLIELALRRQGVDLEAENSIVLLEAIQSTYVFSNFFSNFWLIFGKL